MTTKPKSLWLTVKPEIMRDLDRIREHHGINNNSDTLRFLIRKEARLINKRK